MNRNKLDMISRWPQANMHGQIQQLRSERAKTADLFFGTMTADHSGGQLHQMILILIMANITRVSPTTARESEKKRIDPKKKSVLIQPIQPPDTPFVCIVP